jgi:2-methylaconitate cis-trans-isomerase PrpF
MRVHWVWPINWLVNATVQRQNALMCRHMATGPKKPNRAAAAYYRGGTSRAVVFRQQDLPPDPKEWGPIFCGCIGSMYFSSDDYFLPALIICYLGPDPNGRQLDGLGGGISSLSKVCVVGPPSHPLADVDYTFAAIGVKDNDVDYSSNCGVS